ncbi:MAG: adenylate/guanylate cyclase domain-containing protein [Chloroflexi bacterium]|nr:adenylate/guanylate cyclase domain-containing protein [Chloroflexota bacterium]
MPLPTGPAVVFLFTDIEGSTRLERLLGAAAWAAAAARHDELLRAAIEGAGGVVVKTEGDAFFAAFERPAAAIAAVVAAQRSIAAEAWGSDLRIRVRMGLHLGEGRLRAGRAAGEPEDYVGIDVNYTARIAAAGNGGQIVMAEIDTVREALAANRIVTLVGPGGSGKTRLALGVAREVRAAYPHGAWFIDLAAVRDPALIEAAIAATIDVRESPERTIQEALGAYLRDRTALLVLDNLEQLLPAGADLVARLVRAAPNLRLIVTSRELLRIAGERGHPVPPLDLEAGVALFVDRARAHRPDLVLAGEGLVAVRAICERLGGLPLAIELAAARVRMLSPHLILERLGRSLDLAGGSRDMPERQRTLRGAIAWSHDLLAAEERRLFARLGVFAGGWTAETADPVADPDGTLGIDLVTGLESLADKSLIRIEPGGMDPDAPELDTRFSLHPLLREYAMERLTESGERQEVEARFTGVCAEVAETAGATILALTGEASLRRLDREDRNLREAMEWSLANGNADLGLRIIGATWRWFQQRGRLREGLALASRLLAAPTGGDARVRIAGLTAVGGLAYWTKDFAVAQAAYDERLALAETTGDPVLIADGHYDLGFMAMVAQDGARLLEHEQRALDLYLAAGRTEAAVRARQAIVLSVFLAGDYDRARDLELQNLEAFRATGSLFQIADSSTLLSAIHWREGDTRNAWKWASEGLGFFARIESATGLARALAMAAIILLEEGRGELGARVTGAVYRLVREQGVMLAPVEVLHLPDPGQLSVERLGAERAAELMAEGDAMALPDILAMVDAAAAGANSLD